MDKIKLISETDELRYQRDTVIKAADVLEIQRDNALREAEELRQQRDTAIAALEAVEWGDCRFVRHGDTYGPSHYCPKCHGEKPEHADDCQLAAALAKAKGQ